MKYLFIGCLSLFLIACGGGNTETTTKPTPQEKTAQAEKPTVNGVKIYKKFCISCHGAFGDMGASGAFNLTTTTLTLDEKIEVIANGRNTMTAFKGVLKEEEIKAVAEFTETLKEE